MAKHRKLITIKLGVRYIITSSLIVIASCVTATTIVFLDANKYKNDIQTIIKYKTGFVFDYANIQTGFTNKAEPFIYIDNLSLNEQTHQATFKLKKLQLVLSLSSITNLTPIFKLIQLSGSDLNLVLDKNILRINNYPIDLTDNNKDSKLAIGKLINLQQNIVIDSINTQIVAHHTPVKKLNIDNISFNLSHPQLKSTLAKLKINIQNNTLASSIEFIGNDLLDITTWQNGLIKLDSEDSNDYLIHSVGKITQGQLDYIHASLDSNHNLINYSKKFSTINNATGKISLERNSQNSWDLNINNINLQSKQKKLLENFSLDGTVSWSNGGIINIKNQSINDFGNILNYFESNIKIHTTGRLTTQIKWQNTITSPTDVMTQTQFKNVHIAAEDNSIPNINNLNINIATNDNNIKAKLKLKNSIIDYPEVLLTPLKLNLYADIATKIESDPIIKIESLQVDNEDFNVNGTIRYSVESNIIDANLLMQFFNLGKAYKYVPVTMGKSVEKDFRENLQGMMRNIKISAHGHPESFPFIESNGSYFTVDGNINHINYLWLTGWPKLLNTQGQLKVRNQDIFFTVHKGYLGNLPIQTGSAEIPNFVANDSTLRVNGTINTATNNFIAFANNTPYASSINNIESNVKINGNSLASLKSITSLSGNKPAQLSGNFKVIKNSIQITDNERINLDNLSAYINFNQDGLINGSGNSQFIGSNMEFNFTPANISANIQQLDFANLSKNFAVDLNNLITGSTNINLNYDTTDDIIKLNADFNNTEITAPVPLNKPMFTPANLTASYNLNNNEILTNYNDVLNSNVELDNEHNLVNANIYLGTRNINQVELESGNKVNVTVALNDTHVEQWLEFATKIASLINDKTQDNAITQPLLSESEINKMSAHFIESAQTNITNESQPIIPPIFPIGIKWQSNSFWYDHYNINSGVINAYIYPSLALVKISSPDIEGKLSYTQIDNQIDMYLERLSIAKDYIYTPESSSLTVLYPDNESENKIYSESNAQFKSQEVLDSKDTLLLNSEVGSESDFMLYNESADTNLIILPILREKIPHQNISIPTLNVKIKNLYINNYYWGSFNGHLIQQQNDLILDNALIHNNAGFTRLNLINHCFTCTTSAEKFVSFNTHSAFNNFGDFMTKANQGGLTKKGNGVIDINGSWQGDIESFSVDKLTLYAGINLQDGVLVKIKPGLFGALMGVANLSALNLTNFSFNGLFGQIFDYNDISANLYVNNNIVNIEKFNLNSEVADITTFGRYYIKSNTIDTIMTVTPKMDATVATTAGIVTLNPIIGGIVYLAQKLLGDPINSLFTTSYHVEGDVNNPTMQPTNLGKQFLTNVTSSGEKLLPVKNTNNQ